MHLEATHDPPFFVISRHADVMTMLTQPELWNSRDGSGVFYQPGGVLGSADGEVHRRQRKVLQDGFRPTAIDSLAPRVDRIGIDLWEAAFGADRGEGDFVRLFAFPFPAIVIAELLGVPVDRRDEFGHWSDDIVNGLGGGDLALVEIANAGIFALVDELVAERKELVESGATPPDDLITVLTAAESDGTLTHGEVRRLCQQLLVAGHETTASLIGLMLYRLIERPQLAERLRAEPHLIPQAVEEFLRYDSPVQGLFRTNARRVPDGRGHRCRTDEGAGAVRGGQSRSERVGPTRRHRSRSDGTRVAASTLRSDGEFITASVRPWPVAKHSWHCS